MLRQFVFKMFVLKIKMLNYGSDPLPDRAYGALTIARCNNYSFDNVHAANTLSFAGAVYQSQCSYRSVDRSSTT